MPGGWHIVLRFQALPATAPFRCWPYAGITGRIPGGASPGDGPPRKADPTNAAERKGTTCRTPTKRRSSFYCCGLGCEDGCCCWGGRGRLAGGVMPLIRRDSTIGAEGAIGWNEAMVAMPERDEREGNTSLAVGGSHLV